MINVKNLPRMLAMIPADDYQTYAVIVAALKHAAISGELSEPSAREMAESWARKSNKFDNDEFRVKWNSYRDENAGDKAGIGTIYHLAVQYGYRSEPVMPAVNTSFRLGDKIRIDGVDEVGSVDDAADLDVAQARDNVFEFLDLFDASDRVCIVLSADCRGGKWIPDGKGVTRTITEWKDIINRSIEKNGLLFSEIHTEMHNGVKVSYNHEAGVWVRINDTDGKGVSDSNVEHFRYTLIESDTIPKDEQLKALQRLGLPYALCVDSGNKSVHGIVRVDAKTRQEYALAVRQLQDFCLSNGYRIDTATTNPSRLVRLPGVRRGENWQRVLLHDSGKSYTDWLACLQYGTPIDISCGYDDFNPERDLAPEVIKGVLRKGHKMLLGGSSKAGKSFALIELAAALASGGKWLGWECRKSKVLYFNFEIDPASFVWRIHKVCDALHTRPEPGMLQVWNMRGKFVGLDDFIDAVTSYCSTQHIDVLIIDPIYKLTMGDENKASDIIKLCNAFDRLASVLDASVVYCHHFAKGTAFANASKAVADRVSGSGVFGRDADAILTMTQLDFDGFSDDDNTTGWRVDACLREFAPPKPFNIFFRYPVHVIDTEDVLSGASFTGDTNKAGGAARGKQLADEKAERYDIFQKYLHSRLELPGGRCDMVDGRRAVRSIEVQNALDLPKSTLSRYMSESDKYEYVKLGRVSYIVLSQNDM